MSHMKARPALADLPVNVSQTPRLIGSASEGRKSLKRYIYDVEDPEYPSKVIRSCREGIPLKTDFGGTSSQNIQRDEVGLVEEIKSSNPTNLPSPQMKTHVANMDDGDSQSSPRDSIYSLPDFDGEDETMVSQETTATEVTATAQSMVTARAEILRLRLRVALFKVQTNQIDTPMSQLKISIHRPNKPLETASASVSPVLESSMCRLPPKPVRQAYAHPVNTSPPKITSSAPTSDDPLRSPALPRDRRQGHSIQISSPPTSPSNVSAKEDKCLTRSAVRGNAAIGLLNLNRMKY